MSSSRPRLRCILGNSQKEHMISSAPTMDRLHDTTVMRLVSTMVAGCGGTPLPPSAGAACATRASAANVATRPALLGRMTHHEGAAQAATRGPVTPRASRGAEYRASTPGSTTFVG